MKEQMYTYHYFRNRCVMRPERTAEYVMGAVIATGIVFFFLCFTVK